jgi:hypothetical protein
VIDPRSPTDLPGLPEPDEGARKVAQQKQRFLDDASAPMSRTPGPSVSAMTVRDGKLVKKTEIVTAAEALPGLPAGARVQEQEEEASEGDYDEDEAVVLPWEDEVDADVEGDEEAEGSYSDDERFAGKSDDSQMTVLNPHRSCRCFTVCHRSK